MKQTGTGAFAKVTKLQVNASLANLVSQARKAMQVDPAKAKAELAASLKRIGPPEKNSTGQLERLGAEFKTLSSEKRHALWQALPQKVREAAVRGLQTGPGIPQVALEQVQSMKPAELEAVAAGVESTPTW